MKKYLLVATIFLLAVGTGMLLHQFLSLYIDKVYISIILRTYLSLVFIMCTLYYVKDKTTLFRFSMITREALWVTLAVVVLFVINNYCLAHFSKDYSYIRKGSTMLILLGYFVNSFFEEFAYRGFIQNYINQEEDQTWSLFSRGAIVASLLMTVTHLGFFTVMDPIFATTGIILVLIFSLSMSYLRDKGISIWWLIIIHTMVNLIHFGFNY